MENVPPELIPILSTQFDVDIQDNWAAFYTALVQQLQYLIKYKTEHLMWVLYRIDVDEQKAMQALGGANAADKLSRLIVERQIQKWHTRQSFKSE
jgi:hypothetical protein